MVLLTAVILLSSIIPRAAHAGSTNKLSGDILHALIPASAYIATFCTDDKEGRKQFYKSLLTTAGVTYTLKIVIDKDRPNGTNEEFAGGAFPSGHTSLAFQGATFITKRYGWKYGIPAYAGAAFVGYTRVQTGWHEIEDVVGGAAIGIVSAIYFTTPFKGINVTPVVDKDMTALILYKEW